MKLITLLITLVSFNTYSNFDFTNQSMVMMKETLNDKHPIETSIFAQGDDKLFLDLIGLYYY